MFSLMCSYFVLVPPALVGCVVDDVEYLALGMVVVAAVAAILSIPIYNV